MNPENRWVKKSETIPWNEIEERYSSLFPSRTGMPAKPLQTALGSLLIQKQYPNSGTMILDATYAPQQISYPQDINLLNEARVNLENIIDSICYEYNYYKPRMYRDNARRDYLSIAMNVDHLTDVHAVLFLISIFSRYKRQQKLPKISIVNSFA